MIIFGHSKNRIRHDAPNKLTFLGKTLEYRDNQWHPIKELDNYKKIDAILVRPKPSSFLVLVVSIRPTHKIVTRTGMNEKTHALDICHFCRFDTRGCA